MMNDNDTFFFMYIVWNTWQITDRHILSLCNASWSWIVNEIIYIFAPLYLSFFFFFFFYYLKSSLHFTDMNDIELVKKAYVGFPRKSIIFPCYREILPIHVHCMWLAESLNFNLFPAVESLTNRGHLNKRSRTELYFSGAGRGI